MSQDTGKKYIKAHETSKKGYTRDLPISGHILAEPSYKKREEKKRSLTLATQTQLVTCMHEGLLDQGDAPKGLSILY